MSPFDSFRARLHAQQPLGVAAQDLDLVLVAKRNRFHPVRRQRILDERPVDTEHDTVDSHLHHAAEQRWIGEVAARRNVEIVTENVAETHPLLARTRKGLVDAPDQEGQCLPEMPEDDLQPRMDVEHPAEHHPDRLGRCFHRVAPGRAGQHREILDVVLVVDVDDGGMGYRRMQVDRNVEFLGTREDRPEALVVDELPVGEPGIMAPLKPSLSTVLSNSSAAAAGSLVGSAAKAAKRLGFASTAA